MDTSPVNNSSIDDSPETLPDGPLWELTDADRMADPDLEAVRLGRLGVALSTWQTAYGTAYDQFKSQDARAATLAGWIAAVIALSIGQINGHMLSFHRATLILCLALFLAAFFIAVSALWPRSIKFAAPMDPLDLYNYETQTIWDQIDAPDTEATALAEAQTQLVLIKSADRSIKALRKARDLKANLVVAALCAFGVGMALFVFVTAMGPICALCRLK